MSFDPAQRHALAIESIANLVAFETQSDRSNLRLIEHVEAYCQARAVPFVRIADASGTKAALFITIGPLRDGGIVLSGHSDVVPVTGQLWSHDPFCLREQDGRLYGRGACDMKGFVGIVLSMFDEWQALPLTRPIHLLLSYDEETTCLGALDTLARLGVDLPRPSLVIVGEPTLMQVAHSHKGVLTCTTTITGHEAHSSRPALGASAIAAAGAFIHALGQIGAELERHPTTDPLFDPPYSTINVGTITGGTARNILARQCVLEWECRFLPAQPARWILERLEQEVEGHILPALRRHAPAASMVTQVDHEVPALVATPGSREESLVLHLARSNHTIGVPFATEAGHFRAAGLPTLVCGPGSINQAHQPDEWLAIEQVDACIAFLCCLAHYCCE
jgi:acetylornithine deacetylase